MQWVFWERGGISCSIRQVGSEDHQLQTQYVAVDSSKNELQKSYDASLSRLDSLTGFNNDWKAN